jgi:hypothetical protein
LYFEPEDSVGLVESNILARTTGEPAVEAATDFEELPI